MTKLWISLFALLAVSSVIDSIPTKDFKSLVKPNTPENIEKLNNLGPDDLAELYSGQFEGDIILEEGELDLKRKTVLIASRYSWAGGIVPYMVVEGDFTPAQLAHIHLGARKLEEVTCLKFVAYNPLIHNDFIRVIGSDSGCYSYVGRRGTGKQLLNLAVNANTQLESGCMRLYTIVHEFMHAIGIYHMQSATERDDFVEIVWDKIQAGTENNFEKYEAETVTQHGVEYDYGSVMHYPTVAFSIDGSPTIIPLRPLNGQTMGQRVEINEKDAARINAAYCANLPEPPVRPPHPIVVGVNQWVNNLLNNILGSFRP